MDHGGEGFNILVKVIMEKLTPHIEQYPFEEKIILTEFMKTLQKISQSSRRNISEGRNQVYKIIDDFLVKHYRSHKKYYYLPFMWFAADYLNNANRILTAAGFYPTDFYNYLSRYIRGDSTTPGFFELIKTNTRLSNQSFETLQYACNKLNVFLTEEQIEVLKIIFSYINKEGPRALNQQVVKRAVSKLKPNRRFILELDRFFTLLDTLWEIRLYQPAFGLEPCLFHITLEDSTSPFDIIDFNDPRNTTLNTAIIYHIQNSNSYYGTFLLPDGTINLMQSFFEKLKSQEILLAYQLTRVKEIQLSHSLMLYVPEKGWRKLTSAEYRQLELQLTSKNTGNTISRSSSFFPTPLFNKKWDFRSDRTRITPEQFIDLYCKSLAPFTFQELESQGHSNFRLNKKDQRLLQYMFQLRVIHLNLTPIRLYRDFSLDGYWVQIPADINQKKLNLFLGYLSSANIYYTDQETQIWTRLTPKLFQWMNNILKWKVFPVSLYYRGKYSQKEWYDSTQEQWIKPYVFSETIFD